MAPQRGPAAVVDGPCPGVWRDNTVWTTAGAGSMPDGFTWTKPVIRVPKPLTPEALLALIRRR